MQHDNCQYTAEVDEELSRKDVEIHTLQETVQELQGTVAPGGREASSTKPTATVMTEARPERCGKAPPVEAFIGEEMSIYWDK